MKECPLCGCREVQSFRAGRKEILYHRCSGCGYVSMDRSCRLQADEEKQRYDLHENHLSNPGYRSWLESFLHFALDPPPPPGCRVLDFGSGPNPALAALLKGRGYHVETEDPYFSPGIPEGPFRLITALEVFEHLSNPMETMKSLSTRLENEGRLCISTEFLPVNSADFAGWHYRSDPTHIGFFTRQGLIDSARQAGLMPDGGDHVRYIAFRLAHPDTSC